MKFIVDENLSPKVTQHLRSLGFSASGVRDEDLRGKTDEEICIWAKKHNAIVVTRDLDFGLLYKQTVAVGILILRSKDDSTEASVAIINRLHKNGYLSKSKLLSQLTVATENKVRIFKITPGTN